MNTHVRRCGKLNSASARTSALAVIGGGKTRQGRALNRLMIRGRRCPLELEFIATASARSMPVDYSGRTPRTRESAWRDSTQPCW